MNFELIDPNNPRRDFNIMTYYPCNVFKPILERYGKYIFIFHSEDNSTPHYHIALKTQNNIKLSTLHDLIDYEYSLYCEEKNIPYKRQRLTAEPLRDNKIETTVEYYLHENEDSVKKHKHKYSFEQLQGNFDVTTLIKKDTPKKITTQEVNEHFFYDLTERVFKNQREFHEYMAKTYGRDFIKNFTTYQHFRAVYRDEKREEKILSDLDDIEACEEYVFVENTQSFDNVETYRSKLLERLNRLNKLFPHLSNIEAYRNETNEKLEKLNKLYPNPEFKIITNNDIK